MIPAARAPPSRQRRGGRPSGDAGQRLEEEVFHALCVGNRGCVVIVVDGAVVVVVVVGGVVVVVVVVVVVAVVVVVVVVV